MLDESIIINTVRKTLLREINEAVGLSFMNEKSDEVVMSILMQVNTGIFADLTAETVRQWRTYGMAPTKDEAMAYMVVLYKIKCRRFVLEEFAECWLKGEPMIIKEIHTILRCITEEQLRQYTSKEWNW